MYDELVKKLRLCGKGLCTEDCPDWTKNNLYHTCQDEVVLEAADAIEELSREYESIAASLNESVELVRKLQQPRWIPVSERLPEEKRDGFSDDVLMLVENPDGDITWKDVYVGYYLYDATSAETGWWAMMTCDCVKIGEHKYGGKVFPANEYVTHWMPLPDPPKEET